MILLVKLGLLLIGILCYSPAISYITIVGILVMLILSTLMIVSEYKYRSYVYLVIYCIIVFWHQEMIAFLPLVVFDLTFKSRWAYLLGISLIFVMPNSSQTGLLLLLALMSYLLKDFMHHSQKWYDLYFETVDQKESLIKQLSRQNQFLLEHQEQSIALATNEERSRIAREIHDHVGQVISRSLIQLGAIKVINQDQQLALPLEQLQASLMTGMDAIRKSVHHLYDDSFDLKQKLEHLIKEQPFEIRLVVSQIENIPKKLQYDYYMIINEAVNNVQKHSDAKRVEIRIRVFAKFYQLVISDNGQIKNQITTSGIGLQGIQDRVLKWQGEYRFIQEKGFKIHIMIPREEQYNESNDS